MRRTLYISCLALISLAFGSLVYFIRPAGSSLIHLSGSGLNVPLLTTLPVFDNLPSFFHVFAFSLLSAAVLGLTRNRVQLSCFSWLVIGSLFELGQHERFSSLHALPLGLGGYFERGTFDPRDIAACSLGAVLAYLVLFYTSGNAKGNARGRPAFKRPLTWGLTGLASSVLLTACPFFPVEEPYGSLELNTSTTYPYREAYVCPPSRVELSWSSNSARNLRLRSEPAESIDPLLNGQEVEANGNINLEAKSAAVITLLSGQTELDSAAILKAPSSVCKDFGFSLLGAYEGTLEQTVPEPTSRPARMDFYWESPYYDEPPGLRALLYINKQPSPLTLKCSVKSADKTIDCIEPDAEADVIENFSLSLVGTENGLSGSYEGSERGAAVAIDFAGNVTMRKQESEPSTP